MSAGRLTSPYITAAASDQSMHAHHIKLLDIEGVRLLYHKVLLIGAHEQPHAFVVQKGPCCGDPHIYLRVRVCLQVALVWSLHGEDVRLEKHDAHSL